MWPSLLLDACEIFLLRKQDVTGVQCRGFWLRGAERSLARGAAEIAEIVAAALRDDIFATEPTKPRRFYWLPRVHC